MIKLLSPLKRKFDTIVACGSSGAIMAGILASSLKKNLLLTKKHYRKYGKTQGIIGKRFIIVDDFIGYGSTLKGIFAEIDELNVVYKMTFAPKCVGIFLYKVEMSNVKNEWEGIPINRIN